MGDSERLEAVALSVTGVLLMDSLKAVCEIVAKTVILLISLSNADQILEQCFTEIVRSFRPLGISADQPDPGLHGSMFIL